MSDNKFSDGSASAYAELPVKSAYLRWRRGNANMRQLAKSDPAQFFGGWKANTKNREGASNPALPLPIVERVSEDGRYTYEAFASNVIEFLPIAHRTRFELREKTKDINGKEKTVIRAVAKERRQGYTPVRQVFGLVYVGDSSAPAVLYIDSWSAFISFERAGQKWGKVNVPAGHALIRRYGSVGTRDKETDALMPCFEVYGESRSTPIDAVDLAHPRFVKVTQDIDDLWEKAQAWKNCTRWNAEGEVNEVIGASVMEKFLARCAEMGLTETDITQLLKENKGNYAEAMKSLEAGLDFEIEKANAEIADVNELEF